MFSSRVSIGASECGCGNPSSYDTVEGDFLKASSYETIWQTAAQN